MIEAQYGGNGLRIRILDHDSTMYKVPDANYIIFQKFPELQ